MNLTQIARLWKSDMFNTDAIYNKSLTDLIKNYTNSQLNNWRGKKIPTTSYMSV